MMTELQIQVIPAVINQILQPIIQVEVNQVHRASTPAEANQTLQDTAQTVAQKGLMAIRAPPNRLLEIPDHLWKNLVTMTSLPRVLMALPPLVKSKTWVKLLKF